MPYGAVDFALASCTGGAATVQVSFSESLAGMEYWKDINGAWVQLPATISGNTATFTIDDNGPYDADPRAGFIKDPSGPGRSSATPTPIPTLSHLGLIALAGLLPWVAARRLRWRA